MDDASPAPPPGSPGSPDQPEPDPVVGLAETHVERLHAQLHELAETVDRRLEPHARRDAIHAVIAAVEHNLGEITRRLHTKDPRQ
jgi:hypothetical protein